MKSNKQRRQEIKTRRLKRAGKKLVQIKSTGNLQYLPIGAVLADQTMLPYTGSYSPMPLYYVDKPFVCKDCGVEQVWTAEQQKWWYEVARGNINSTAIRCRDCRHKEQQRKAEARHIHLQGLMVKSLINICL